MLATQGAAIAGATSRRVVLASAAAPAAASAPFLSPARGQVAQSAKVTFQIASSQRSEASVAAPKSPKAAPEAVVVPVQKLKTVKEKIAMALLKLSVDMVGSPLLENDAGHSCRTTRGFLHTSTPIPVRSQPSTVPVAASPQRLVASRGINQRKAMAELLADDDTDDTDTEISRPTGTGVKRVSNKMNIAQAVPAKVRKADNTAQVLSPETNNVLKNLEKNSKSLKGVGTDPLDNIIGKKGSKAIPGPHAAEDSNGEDVSPNVSPMQSNKQVNNVWQGSPAKAKRGLLEYDALSPRRAPTAKTEDKYAAKKRYPFSNTEVTNLKKGVEKYGVGRWQDILAEYNFDARRTPVDLKDKWRNLTNLTKHQFS